MPGLCHGLSNSLSSSHTLAHAACSLDSLGVSTVFFFKMIRGFLAIFASFTYVVTSTGSVARVSSFQRCVHFICLSPPPHPPAIDGMKGEKSGWEKSRADSIGDIQYRRYLSFHRANIDSTGDHPRPFTNEMSSLFSFIFYLSLLTLYPHVPPDKHLVFVPLILRPSGQLIIVRI